MQLKYQQIADAMALMGSHGIKPRQQLYFLRDILSIIDGSVPPEVRERDETPCRFGQWLKGQRRRAA